MWFANNNRIQVIEWQLQFDYFLGDDNEIDENIFWERLKILEKDGNIINKAVGKGNSFFFTERLSQQQLEYKQTIPLLYSPALGIFVMNCLL